MEKEKKNLFSRRQFITTGAVAATAISGFPFIRNANAQGKKKLKIGVVGTGGRGTGACANAISADPGNVELVAMADIAPEQMEKSLNALAESRELQGELQKMINVPKDQMFTGPDGFEKLLQLDLDYVILTTPPGFRPLQFEAAVRAGKHIFAEKPLATDPVGCRKVRASAEQAKSKGLSVVVGLQTRYSPGAQETVKRIHDGAIGDIKAGSIHRLGGYLWHRGSNPSWSEMEYQMRNWYYYVWLSGDQIVEMVIHQIDLMNWTLGANPISALGNGGRIMRTEEKYGNIYDHMTIDFEYPNDVHVFCMLRQWQNCDNKNDNRAVGTIGESDERSTITGPNRWRSRDRTSNPTVIEHQALQESIHKGAARNDALEYAIDSTMAGIMGRESAYQGKVITWDEINQSDLDLFPRSWGFGPAPERPVPIPGTPRLG